RVRYKRTVAGNMIKAPRAARSLKALSRLVDENKIDLVITDFEPLSCHVGRRKRLPVIAIDNQHTITNANVALPRGFRRDIAATRLVTRMMTPHADAYLALSFFSAPVKKRSLDGFLRDLSGAKAVIANAGFSLISEGLYLDKPYLAIPVKNQFEQT